MARAMAAECATLLPGRNSRGSWLNGASSAFTFCQSKVSGSFPRHGSPECAATIPVGRPSARTSKYASVNAGASAEDAAIARVAARGDAARDDARRGEWKTDDAACRSGSAAAMKRCRVGESEPTGRDAPKAKRKKFQTENETPRSNPRWPNAGSLAVADLPLWKYPSHVEGTFAQSHREIWPARVRHRRVICHGRLIAFTFESRPKNYQKFVIDSRSPPSRRAKIGAFSGISRISDDSLPKNLPRVEPIGKTTVGGRPTRLFF